MVQGTRGLVTGIKENKGVQALKISQIMAIAAGLSSVAREYFAEEYAAIPEQEKATKWIIPLPKSYAYTDENGKTRYRYIAIAKDQGQAVFAAMADSAIAASRGEEFDSKTAMLALKNAFPDLTAGSPIVNAFMAYFDNYDTYRKENVYTGRPATPSTEFSDVEILDKAAQKLSEISDGAVEISPLRLKTAGQKFILPHNPIVMMTGALANEMLPPDVQTKFAEETLTRQPFIRRLIRSTPPIEVQSGVAEKAERLGIEMEGKPGKKVRQEVYEAEQKLGAQRNMQDREIRRLLGRVKTGNANKYDLIRYIRSQGKDDYGRLRSRILTIQEEFGLDLDIPTQGSSGLPGIPSVGRLPEIR